MTAGGASDRATALARRIGAGLAAVECAPSLAIDVVRRAWLDRWSRLDDRYEDRRMAWYRTRLRLIAEVDGKDGPAYLTELEAYGRWLAFRSFKHHERLAWRRQTLDLVQMRRSAALARLDAMLGHLHGAAA